MPKAELDPATFKPGAPTPALPAGSAPRTFDGFKRPGKLGSGTRNFIVILSVTSESAAFAKTLEERCAKALGVQGGCSGVVAVSHTEGGAGTGDRGSENLLGHAGGHRELLKRTMAGWIVHPNVGAMLIVDAGKVGGPIQFIKNLDGEMMRIRSQVHPCMHACGRARARAERPAVDRRRRERRPAGAVVVGCSAEPIAACV
eukprot:SAG22_NODE_1301_length_4800_cov_6.150394_2_plen_201_part_00